MPDAELKLLVNIEFEGMAPGGQSTRLMRICADGLLDHVAKTGNRSKIEEAWLIPDVCRKPAAIFRDLTRKDTEGIICYSAIALGAFAKEYGKEIEIPKGKVFLVFLTPEFDAAKWRYCQEDSERPGFPVGHETRFGERLWPQD